MRNPASFRDPSGFVYEREGSLLRQVNRGYSADFEHLLGSGLLQRLQDESMLISSTIESTALAETPDAIAVLRPERLPLISYPYEWCFSQLKDAALLTLDVALQALSSGMMLKDASAYNVQFKNGRPIFIDTLSFETYKEGTPWPAYRQFCQHFLGPLALMAHRDLALLQLLRIYIDGIPLPLVAKLLPLKTKFNFGLFAHIHAHARTSNKPASTNVQSVSIPRESLTAFLQSLKRTVGNLPVPKSATQWGAYYQDTNYSTEAMTAKRALVHELLAQVAPCGGSLWDLGANNGEFSRIAARLGFDVTAWDMDPNAVESAYSTVRSGNEENLLPLLLDLTNPSPALGWANEERQSFQQRGPAHVVMALALIHHLCIGNNVPIDQVLAQFESLGKWLLIEFVPKEDSQVQRMLASRTDIFTHYDEPTFIAMLRDRYTIIDQRSIPSTCRTLFIAKRRSNE